MSRLRFSMASTSSRQGITLCVCVGGEWTYGRLGVGGGDGSVDQGTHHRGMYEMDTHVCVQAFHSSTLSHIVVRTTPMK